MQDDEDIPVLIDLIEDPTDVTIPELGLDTGHDMIIEEDADDDPDLTFNPEAVKRSMDTSAAPKIGKHKNLERTVRRILDEHLELAWQEIRLAIAVAMDDEEDESDD